MSLVWFAQIVTILVIAALLVASVLSYAATLDKQRDEHAHEMYRQQRRFDAAQLKEERAQLAAEDQARQQELARQVDEILRGGSILPDRGSRKKGRE